MDILMIAIKEYLIPSPFWRGDLLGFLFFAFVSSVTPGPNNSLLMRSGLQFGIMPSLPHLLGINLGFGFMFLTIGLIAGFISPDMLLYLKYISWGLIGYIAIKIATAPTDISTPSEDNAQRPWGFLKAAAFQWINPKALMMSFAALSAYDLTPLAGAILFTLVNIFAGSWLVAGAILRRFIMGNPILTRIIFVLMAFGLIGTLFL